MDHNRNAWNAHAARYFEENALTPNVVDYCGDLYPTDDDLQLIGDVQGKTLVEVGSGWGNCGIALAKRGANVTCVDLSEEQLATGKRVAEKEGVSVRFLQSDMADLSAVQSASADIVLSVCALQYAKDLAVVFKEIARILKPGGTFIFSVEHPIIKAIGATELWSEEGANARYDFEGPTEWKWNAEDDFTFVSFRRPISTFINALAGSGLSVTHMDELRPKKFSPDWSEHEVRLRTRFPSLLVIKAAKSA